MHGLLLNRVCCFLDFSCSACVKEGTGPVKSSRKYEPLTQGNGLKRNPDLSSTECDVPNEFCVAQQINLKRAQTVHILPFIRVNMAEEGLTRCAVDHDRDMSKARSAGDEARCVDNDSDARSKAGKPSRQRAIYTELRARISVNERDHRKNHQVQTHRGLTD